MWAIFEQKAYFDTKMLSCLYYRKEYKITEFARMQRNSGSLSAAEIYKISSCNQPNVANLQPNT